MELRSCVVTRVKGKTVDAAVLQRDCQDNSVLEDIQATKYRYTVYFIEMQDVLNRLKDSI